MGPWNAKSFLSPATQPFLEVQEEENLQETCSQVRYDFIVIRLQLIFQ
jgi:hypothetical protein